MAPNDTLTAFYLGALLGMALGWRPYHPTERSAKLSKSAVDLRNPDWKTIMSTIYNTDGVVERRASIPRPSPCPDCGCIGAHFCTGGQVATSYVGVKDAYDLSQDELARVRRARSNTEEALSLERDVRNALDRVKSAPCTCKKKAQDKADRLQRMERLVTGRT